MNDSIKVMELVGSGKEFNQSIENFALAILKARSDLPVDAKDIEREIEALKIYLLGLQDPDSDLFINNK